MPISNCYLFKNSYEFVPISDIAIVPPKVRGIYVLFHEQIDSKSMNVVYIGMARGENSGAKARLKSHKNSKSKIWTHFSVYGSLGQYLAKSGSRT